MTQEKKPTTPAIERRSGTDRRKEDRRDTARDQEKGILSTRKEDRRKEDRRKEDREK